MQPVRAEVSANEGESAVTAKQPHWLERERSFQRDVRDVLATVLVEWYEDRVHYWWSAWLLLWTAIGIDVMVPRNE
jgi:hypothetical protein